MRIYIGHDERMTRAFAVAAKTARSFGCEVIPLRESVLRASGILTRPVDHRDGMYDLNSSAPQSTDFAIARFAVPMLAHAGWCLFADSDVVFLRDPHELMECADESKAVMVVKHDYVPRETYKMDGRPQTRYPRKLWSSVCLWNCDHPANTRLNLTTLNQWPGRDLHAFKWLVDSEIGALRSEWNWLVGIQPRPENAALCHFTLGGPWLPNWKQTEDDSVWLNAEAA